ncbi:unnamed protein product [Urochloa humidicola]
MSAAPPPPSHRILFLPLGIEMPLADPVSAVLEEEKGRDWPNLMPDLVGKISGCLLPLDAATYLHFRAACKT